MKVKYSLIALFIINSLATKAQTTQNVDTSDQSKTSVGGYGNFYYQSDNNEKTSEINLERIVLFLQHRFNNKITFISELEVEDAKVSGGEPGGEVAIEQAYIKFEVTRNSYLTAGLFLPRIGFLNENHLPNTFNGNERTQVETYIIPSTWRELGVGFYTDLNSAPISLSCALINGLNSAGFEHGTVIRDGRYEGSAAAANSLAFTGAVLYNKNNFRAQLSGYYGGTVGLSKEDADTLSLDSGPFGTPAILGEADVQYSVSGFTIKALASVISIPDAENINAAYANDTPEGATGFYAEASYDFLTNFQSSKKRSLIGFIRYEMLDMNSKIPDNTYEDSTLKQNHTVFGVGYFPNPNIAIKADMRLMSWDKPDSAPSDYDDNNNFINLGVGFSF